MLAFIIPESGELLTKFISQLCKFSSKIDSRMTIWIKSVLECQNCIAPWNVSRQNWKPQIWARQKILLDSKGCYRWCKHSESQRVWHLPLTGPSWMVRQAIQLPGVHDSITRSKTTHLAKQKAQMNPCCSLGGLKIAWIAARHFGWCTWLLWATVVWDNFHIWNVKAGSDQPFWRCVSGLNVWYYWDLCLEHSEGLLPTHTVIRCRAGMFIFPCFQVTATPWSLQSFVLFLFLG